MISRERPACRFVKICAKQSGPYGVAVDFAVGEDIINSRGYKFLAEFAIYTVAIYLLRKRYYKQRARTKGNSLRSCSLFNIKF